MKATGEGFVCHVCASHKYTTTAIVAAMLWDVHLEGANYEETRLAEVQQYRKAFIARRCPVSPVDSPLSDSGAAVRAKGIFSHLSEEERLKKEQEMDAWRLEKFKRRDEERRVKEETVRKQAEEQAAAEKLKAAQGQIAAMKSGKAKKQSGYAIFSTETRAQFQKANPAMPSKDITKMCKTQWETMHKDRKKQYDDKAKAENKAAREKVNAEKKKAKAMQAKLDKDEEKKRAAAMAAGGLEEEETEWIQCGQCDKWRIVPNEMAALLDSTQTQAWTCAMNTWDAPPPAGTAACDVAEQSLDDQADDDAGDAEGMAMTWPPEKYEIGLPCDAKDEYGQWYKSTVVEVSDPNGPGKGEVKVHYLGWGNKYDEWVDSKPEADLLAQRGAHTKKPKKNVFHGVAPDSAGAGGSPSKRKAEEEAAGSPGEKKATQ